MELENAVGIYDKMQVVYKEMTSDIVKNYTSNPLEPIISHKTSNILDEGCL